MNGAPLTKSMIREKFVQTGFDSDKTLEHFYAQGVPLRPVFKTLQLFPEYYTTTTVDINEKIKQLKTELGL